MIDLKINQALRVKPKTAYQMYKTQGKQSIKQ